MADNELTQLRTEVLTLRQQLAELRHLADLTAAAVLPATGPGDAVPVRLDSNDNVDSVDGDSVGEDSAVDTAGNDEAATPIGRRQLLRRIGYAAAGAAAAGALVGGDRAAAANGDALLIGQSNTGTSGTTLTGSALAISSPVTGIAPLSVDHNDVGHILLTGDIDVTTATPTAGLIARDGNALWVGNNTSWRTFGGIGCAGALYLLDAPRRVYDSRTDTGVLLPNFERTVSLSSVLPVGASAAIINLTASGYSGVGLFAVYSAAVTWPGNSTLNYSVGSATATSATTAVSDAGAIKIRCSGVQADAIVDVIGYYR